MASASVIASICGCWNRESGVNPGIWESLTPVAWNFQYDYTGKGGFGLGQWTNVGTPNGRLFNLHNWVTSNGYSDGNGDGQVAYMLYESYWTNSTQTRGEYNTLQEFLDTNSTSINDLVWDFLANWEGVVGDHYEERLAKAIEFYAYIDLHKKDDPTQYKWVSKNVYLSEAEKLNNVMCVYFLLSTPQPPTPTKRKHMPVYMMCRKRY